jgi:glycosyltransferase involved in cell wall biosynthesis
MPKVSVITPVYNGARFLSEAIESVLSQTLEDWELIVVDDGSIDETPALLERVTDSRVIKIRQENQGAAAARNAALDVAAGEFIGLLDADDLYLPNALGDMVGYLEGNPALDVVYSDGLMCGADKRPIMQLTNVRPGLYSGWILERLVLSPSIITVPVCTLTRRAAIRREGIRFDGRLAPSEDWDFWVHLARYAQFGYLDKLTCMYRIHQTNVSRTTHGRVRNEKRYLARLKIMGSEWFGDLSLATRVQFFYDLLIGVLVGQGERQLVIMSSSPFLNLPPRQQGYLHRMVASSYLLEGKEAAFAKRCLEQSLVLTPRDGKSRLLLRLLGASPWLCSLTLSAWQRVHDAGTYLRTPGRRKPKPVPAALRDSMQG